MEEKLCKGHQSPGSSAIPELQLLENRAKEGHCLPLRLEVPRGLWPDWLLPLSERQWQAQVSSPLSSAQAGLPSASTAG